MDSTPIYTELQKTLIDPEADHWDTSAPPEFVASLDEPTEQSRPQTTGSQHSGETSNGQTSRTGGRRHRAEE